MKTCPRRTSSGKNCRKKVNNNNLICIPSTSASVAITMGGHVRVGMEDNIFARRRELAKSNAELVEKAVRLADELGREIASSNEAREMLNLKGLSKVNF